MTSDKPVAADDYTVGWICALPLELAASKGMLDEIHPSLPTHPQDNNSYTLGRVGKHNVAIACLPHGGIGTVSAATAAAKMLSTFPQIRFGLMVGIGAGVPSDEHDIRLGDVVVSTPTATLGGVIQYDFGKTVQDGKFRRTGSLNKPPSVLLSALSTLESDHLMEPPKAPQYLSEMTTRYPRMDIKRPNPETDQLYAFDYEHPLDARTCSTCDPGKIIIRSLRPNDEPVIHYGLVASGNQVMRDGRTREKLRKEYDVICFEMEAAGLMDNFPCLVIRGICDYADSHKHKTWQNYAAAIAAAFAKELLHIVEPRQVELSPTAKHEMERLSDQIVKTLEATHRVENVVQSFEESKILDWLSSTSVSFSGPQDAARRSHTAGTGQWLLEDPKYIEWYNAPGGLFWLQGVVGSGKTVLCSTVIKNMQDRCKQDPTIRLAYWYFQFSNPLTQSVSSMLRSLLRQLSTSPICTSVRSLWDRHYRAGSQPTADELAAALNEIIQRSQETIIIVMDALDECPCQDGERSHLLSRIQYLKDHSKLKMLVTSRPEPDIRAGLTGFANDTINIESFVEDDIRQFVESAIKTPRLSRWGPEITSQISENVLSIEERRFRWAELQIKRFIDCMHIEEITEALKTIPQTLEDSYQLAFETVPERRRKYVEKIMMWLAFSFEPLKASQVATIIGFPSSDDVLRMCTSLLVTIIDRDTDQTIKLAHFSVKEYLVIQQSSEKMLGWYRFSSQLAHSTIAIMSLNILLEPECLDSVLLNHDGHRVPIFLHYYSAKFWPRHTHRAGRSVLYDDLQKRIDALLIFEDPAYYYNWLDLYDCDDPNRDLETSSQPFPQPLYYACYLGLKESVLRLWEGEMQLECHEGTYGNSLNAAAAEGNFEVVEWLIHQCTDFTQYLDLTKVAKHAKKNPRKMISFLLTASQNKIKISDEVVKAAACNRHDGAVLQWLLDEKLDEVRVTNEVVVAAASGFHGETMIQLLLDKRQNEIHITSEVLRAAASNRYGTAVLQLLLDRCSKEVCVDAGVITAAAGNVDFGEQMMELLLDQQQDEIHISDETVQAAAKNSHGAAVLELLLDQRPAEVNITDDVVKAAVNNYHDTAVLRLLLDRCPDNVNISSEILTAAAGNQYCGEQMLQLLLDRCPNEVRISNDMVTVAAGNRLCGEHLVRLLLDRRPGEVHITKDVITVAAHQGNESLMRLLLDLRPDEVRIDAAVTKAVAANMCHGEPIMRLLLDRFGEEVKVTQEILETAAWTENYDCSLLELLLDRRGGEITISEDVLKVAAGNETHGHILIQLFLDRRGHEITITEDILKVAAGNEACGDMLIQLFLDRRGDEVMITEDILKVAAGNWKLGESIIQILFDKRGDEVQITESIIKAAATSGTLQNLALLLDADEDLESSPLFLICRLFNSSSEGDEKDLSDVLSTGIDPDLRDIYNHSPLWLGVCLDNTSVVRLLLDTKAVDVNCQDSTNGATPVIRATIQDNAEVVAMLLGAGADVNLADKYGDTPLTLAKALGYQNIERILKDYKGMD